MHHHARVGPRNSRSRSAEGTQWRRPACCNLSGSSMQPWRRASPAGRRSSPRGRKPCCARCGRPPSSPSPDPCSPATARAAAGKVASSAQWGSAQRDHSAARLRRRRDVAQHTPHPAPALQTGSQRAGRAACSPPQVALRVRVEWHGVVGCSSRGRAGRRGRRLAGRLAAAACAWHGRRVPAHRASTNLGT